MKFKEEWFNDNDFWEQYAPVMFDDKRWAEVAEVADGVTRLSGLSLYGVVPPNGGAVDPYQSTPARRADKGKARKKGPYILDLCCGFGRITLELSRRGFITAGVDITAAYLNTAREDASHEGLEIEFIKDDVRSFRRKNTFDAAVNLYNSFGFFENPDDDLLFLKNAHYSIRAGGALIIDVLGKEIAVRDYTEAEWFERAGFIVLTESMPVDSWGSIWNRWILIKDGTRRRGSTERSIKDARFPSGVRREKVFIQRLYAASELRSLLFKAGFSTVELYGGWDERPYDQNADTLIAVGRKGA